MTVAVRRVPRVRRLPGSRKVSASRLAGSTKQVALHLSKALAGMIRPVEHREGRGDGECWIVPDTANELMGAGDETLVALMV